MESIFRLLDKEHSETSGWNWYKGYGSQLFYRYGNEFDVTYDYPWFIKDELIVEEE